MEKNNLGKKHEISQHLANNGEDTHWAVDLLVAGAERSYLGVLCAAFKAEELGDDGYCHRCKKVVMSLKNHPCK